MGIINWFRKLNEEMARDKQMEIENWNKRPIKFKTKLRCTNCKHIFSMDFRDGESIFSHQHWRGHYAHLNSDCPEYKDGFIHCPLCNQDECRVINTNLTGQKREAMEVQILP